jgi:hypothetical protein
MVVSQPSPYNMSCHTISFSVACHATQLLFGGCCCCGDTLSNCLNYLCGWNALSCCSRHIVKPSCSKATQSFHEECPSICAVWLTQGTCCLGAMLVGNARWPLRVAVGNTLPFLVLKRTKSNCCRQSTIRGNNRMKGNL